MQKELQSIVLEAVKRLPSDASFMAAMRGISRLSGGMTIERRGDAVVLAGRHHVSGLRRLPFYVRGLDHRARKLSNDYLLDHIRFDPGDVVVDCGANVGDLLLALDGRGVPLRYVAFEPGKLEFECLQHNMQQFPKHAVELHQAALGERNGTAAFHANSQAADGSLLEIEGATETFEVEVVRLDSLPIGPIKLLKLEAEGYEPEVLEGAQGVLDRIEYISAEVEFERGQTHASTLPAVTNFLLANGFTVVANGKGRLVLLFRNTRFPQATASSAP